MKKVLMSLLVLVLQLPALLAARYEQVESKIVEETLSSGFVPTSLKSTAISLQKMMGKVDLKSDAYIEAILHKLERAILKHSKIFFCFWELDVYVFYESIPDLFGVCDSFCPLHGNVSGVYV